MSGTNERGPSGARKGESSRTLCDKPSGPDPHLSPRQLPTNHDYAGEPTARSANIRVINRRRLPVRPSLRSSRKKEGKKESIVLLTGHFISVSCKRDGF